MNQIERAQRFHRLHVAGDPVILYNIWDAGTAKGVEEAGAAAVATGSWSVAAAHGYDDGEHIPLDLLCTVVERICATVSVPVSADFEGGYAAAPDAVADNVSRILDAGAVGINFEDRIVSGSGLHETETQAARIAAIRDMAGQREIDLFINARTDLFLQSDPQAHAGLIDDAIDRARAYGDAGASGFFVPGLSSVDLIRRVCDAIDLPLNVMMLDGMPSPAGLAKLGVARVSHGPGPYRSAMKSFGETAARALTPDRT